MPANVLHSLYNALIYSRITYAICACGSAYPTALKRLKSLVEKISIKNIPQNRPDCSFHQYDKVSKYFILCKLLWVICDGKHLQFVNKIDQHSIAHNYETRSNVGNCFTAQFYSKKYVSKLVYLLWHPIMEWYSKSFEAIEERT